MFGFAHQSRQSLLFSATVTKEVRDVSTLFCRLPPDMNCSQVAQIALKANYAFISTVSNNENATHSHVAQEHVLLQRDKDILPVIAKLVRENTKSIVFFPTARAAALAYEVVRQSITASERVSQRVDHLDGRGAGGQLPQIRDTFKAEPAKSQQGHRTFQGFSKRCSLLERCHCSRH